MTIRGVYALVEGDDEGSDKLYKKLQKILNKINTPDMIMMMGDFNVRADNVKIEQNIGAHEEQTCNRNSLTLIDYVLYNQLKIMNTMFKHKDSHKHTWMARNQRSIIDYVICNKKLAGMALNTGVYHGPEIESECPIHVKPR
jgi:exonuclease III